MAEASLPLAKRTSLLLGFAGPILIVFAAFHAAMTLVLFSDPVMRILAAGAGGGEAWALADPEALAAFWFLAFSWPTLALGIAVRSAYRRHGTVPAAGTIGWVLILSTMASGVVLPLSGLWAFLIPGAMLVAGSRQAG